MATKNKSSHENYKIKISKNGPYLISGGIPLIQKIIKYDSKHDSCEWENDKSFPSQDTFALCRCGQSNNKPFCDGTHIKVNFDGTETANPKTYYKNIVELDGSGLKLTDAKDLCASARFCHRAGGIWNLILSSDNTIDKQIAIAECADCPSGRLDVYDKKTEKLIEPPSNPPLS